MKSKIKSKKIILGITGSFGCGKTSVARMFRKLGASCISADNIYHGLIKPESPLYKKIVSFFGSEILKKNNEIDREKLGRIVFDKNVALKKLTQITHPVIIKRMKTECSKLKRAKANRIIAIDAPLLIEAGLIEMVDKLIVVKISRKTQIARCRKHWGVPGDGVIKRIRTQIPLTEKVELADYVIDNNGTLEQTRKQVKGIWKEIQKGGRRWK